jgi:hypothetical protein
LWIGSLDREGFLAEFTDQQGSEDADNHRSDFRAGVHANDVVVLIEFVFRFESDECPTEEALRGNECEMQRHLCVLQRHF